MTSRLSDGLRFLREDGSINRRAMRAWVERQIERSPALVASVSPWAAAQFDGWTRRDWFRSCLSAVKAETRGEQSIWEMRAGVNLVPVEWESA